MVGKPTSPWEKKELEQSRTTVLEALVCPHCFAPITLKALGITKTTACTSCDSILDVSVSPDQKGTSLVMVEKGKATQIPTLPLGSRCKLHGTTWEVTGFMVRSHSPSPWADNHEWKEYLLFNPYKGYRWLVEDRGRWLYFIPLHEIPKNDPIRSKVTGKETVSYSGNHYTISSTIETQVEYLSGEFYWRVRYGDNSEVTEYSHPPHLLTKESVEQEVNWSFGEYLTETHLLKAFEDDPAYSTIKERMPKEEQTSDEEFEEVFPALRTYEKPFYITGSFLFALFLILHLTTGILFPEQMVYKTTQTLTYENAKALRETGFTSPVIEVKSAYGGMGFYLSSSSLRNNWLSVEGELINEATGEAEHFETGIEFYSGYDDGLWTEGSREIVLSLPAVSPGKYKLLIQVFEGDSQSFSLGKPRGYIFNDVDFTIELTQNHQSSGTFWFITVLLLLLPIGVLVLSKLKLIAQCFAYLADD